MNYRNYLDKILGSQQRLTTGLIMLLGAIIVLLLFFGNGEATLKEQDNGTRATQPQEIGR